MENTTNYVDLDEERKEEIVNTIINLIEQANRIEKEDASVENAVSFENVGDSKEYIEITDKKVGNAKDSLETLKELPKSRFYTFGRNKKNLEVTQETLGYIVDAVDNNASATKALFKYQTAMAIATKKIYGISLMSIAANRFVVREIKQRLEGASKETLSNLARQELEYVINEVKRQESIEAKIDDNYDKMQDKFDKVDLAIEKNKELILKNVSAREKYIENKLQKRLIWSFVISGIATIIAAFSFAF